MSEPNQEGGWLKARGYEGCFSVLKQVSWTRAATAFPQERPEVCGVGDEVRKEDPQVVDDRRGADVDQGLCGGGDHLGHRSDQTWLGVENLQHCVGGGRGGTHGWRGTETT